jgi:uncharacterized integral membrane protein
MVIGFLRWIITVVCLSTLLTWALLNRSEVMFDPSPVHDAVSIPLYVLIMGVALVGFLWGALITWLHATTDRVDRKLLRREVNVLEKKVAELESAALHANPNAAISGLIPSEPRKASWFR